MKGQKVSRKTVRLLRISNKSRTFARFFVRGAPIVMVRYVSESEYKVLTIKQLTVLC